MEKEQIDMSGILPEAVQKKKRTQNFKNHIAVRDETMVDFRALKDEEGSDAFVKKILMVYRKKRADDLSKKIMKEEQNN